MFLVYEHLSTTAAKQDGSALLQFLLTPCQNCNTASPVVSSGKWRRAHVTSPSSVLCLPAA